MKLIVAAGARLASIGVGGGAAAARRRTWAGETMGVEVEGEDAEVRGESCETGSAGWCQARELHLAAPSRRRPPSTPATAICSAPAPATATMSVLLPRSLGVRLLAPALRPSTRRALALPSTRCHASNEPARQTSSADAPGAPATSDSTQIRDESAAQGLRHQPDYNVAVDYRTSNFSPIPKRVMDGSEPGESVAAAVLSGAPVDLQARTVRYDSQRLCPRPALC